MTDLKPFQISLVYLVSIIIIFLIVVLISTFRWSFVEIWTLEHATIISALGLLLSALIAFLSVQNTIQNSQEIENKRKYDDLMARRLYFGSTMRGLIDIIDQQITTLKKIQHNNLKDPQNIYLQIRDAQMLDYLKEVNEVLKDYIDLINDKSLPDTLYQIRNKETEPVKNLIKLKNDIYNLRSIISSHLATDIHNTRNTSDYLEQRTIIKKLDAISKDAFNLKMNISK